MTGLTPPDEQSNGLPVLPSDRPIAMLCSKILSTPTRRFCRGAGDPLPRHSIFQEALPFGQGGMESAPGDYKGGRRSPLSCPLVAVRIHGRILG
jgi:hypothetical protein